VKKQLLAGLVISAVCLYWALKGLSIAEIAQAFRTADLRWMAVAAVTFVFGFSLRTGRWQQLLLSVKKVSFRRLWRPLVIGFFANNVLPFRAGELIRAHLAGRLFSLSRITTLSSIFLERLFDAAVLLIAFHLAASYFVFPELIRRGSQAGMAALLIGSVGLWVLFLSRSRHDALLGKLRLPPHWIQRLQDGLKRFFEGTSALQKAPQLFSVIGLSLLVWLAEATFLYCMMRAFHLPLPFVSAFFVMFFIALSVSLPQAPGYVGTIEFFGSMALGILGIPKEIGLPVMLAYHGLQFLLIFTLGGIALSMEGLSLRQLSRPEATSA